MEINGIKASQIKTVDKSAVKNDKIDVNNTTVAQTTPNFDGQYTSQMFGILPNIKLSKTLNSTPVSFKGAVLKKSDFDGIDLAVIEKYKPNIQQFKSKDDLQKFAENKINELKEKDFGGRQEETKVQRKAMLKEWFDYVTKENDAYSNTQRLVILSAITNSLKANNDEIPPVLNKGVLADTVSELEEKLKINPKENFDFNKMYQNNLRTNFMQETNTGETMTGWVIIPSKTNDPENFEKNVEKLKTLSHKNWCTKSLNAEPYLSAGDFHVYLENGQPKLGVRFFDNEVQEIQGEKNNGKIPQKYLETFKNYQKEYELKLGNKAKKEVEKAEIAKQEIANIKQTLGSAIELNTIDDAIKIFSYAGIKTEKKDNGLVISKYKQPDISYSYEDLEIDENKLFKYVKEIKGNGNFDNSQITNLGQLQRIGGNADFKYSKITDLGQLQRIGGNANFKYSKITDLGQLQSIGGDVNFDDSQITDLGQLQNIGGNAVFYDSQITTLGQLQNIGGDAKFQYSKITDLGQLQSIGGNVNFESSQITDLGQLQNIGGNAFFYDSQITTLGQLQNIGGNAVFGKYICEILTNWISKVTDLGQLQNIGGNAVFGGSQMTNLGQLQSIGGNVNFDDSQITNLGQLQSIGGDVNFEGSQMTNLGQLQSIGGDVNFEGSQITDLGQLQSIGGNVNFDDSQITDLGQLQNIGGNAVFGGSQMTNLGQLESIGKDADFRKSKISISDINKLKIGGEIKLDDCKAKEKDIEPKDIECKDVESKNIATNEKIGSMKNVKVTIKSKPKRQTFWETVKNIIERIKN